VKHEYLHEAPVEDNHHGDDLLYHEYQDDQDGDGDAVIAHVGEAVQDEGEALLLEGPGDAAGVPTGTPDQGGNGEFVQFDLVG
jgi:hypothetical protein